MEHSTTEVGPIGGEADLNAIDEVRQAPVASINAGDVATFTALFTDDGVHMPPNAPVNLARTPIRTWAQGFFRSAIAHSPWRSEKSE